MKLAVDLLCGMNPQAHLLLQVIAQRVDAEVEESEHLWMTTSPYTNCREMGFVLSVIGFGKVDTLNLCFYEHRNSDSLCAIKWRGQLPIDGGCRAEHIPTEVFPNKWSPTMEWGHGKLWEAAAWAVEEINAHIAFAEKARKDEATSTSKQ